ncbi:RING finger protein 11 [Clonorchis sinensis]|uniref:RING finger protein 11 n=2 Tax=Clonorchis sinensis TaxID=79923 RepID=A0A3R7D567_CLOSI|nr:RING finger protein 11 [Clonorchis sinensis]
MVYTVSPFRPTQRHGVQWFGCSLPKPDSELFTLHDRCCAQKGAVTSVVIEYLALCRFLDTFRRLFFVKPLTDRRSSSLPDVARIWLAMGNCLKCRNNDTQSEDEHREENRRSDHQSRRVFYPGYLEHDPILHPAPGISRPMSQLTEEEQVKIATRMGLISTLPLFTFTEDKREKLTECIICMCEYEEGDELRYLPCLHTYHRTCIDDWLMRALTCPSCLEELRPSSPNVSRSTDSNRNLTRVPLREAQSGEPPSYTVATNPATTTTSLVPGDSSADSQNRGDEVDDGPTFSVMESQLDSSATQPAVKQLADTVGGKNNSSGGDCASVVLQQSRYHRRTRSNGPPVSRAETLTRSPLPALNPGTIRRGNSETELDLVQSSTTFLPHLHPHYPQSSSRQDDQMTPHIQQHLPSLTRQLDGDSHELRPS